MIVRMIWLRSRSDGRFWLEAAMESDQISESYAIWQAEVDRVARLCADSNYEYRICEVVVDGVDTAFRMPQLRAR